MLVACVAAVALAVPAAEAVDGAGPGFRGSISRIPAAQAKRMTGVSWRPGCPVPLRDLRLLTVPHWRFDGRARQGRLVVHRDAARELLAVFRDLHAAGFPIRRIVPVDAYAGSDFRSIERLSFARPTPPPGFEDNPATLRLRRRNPRVLSGSHPDRLAQQRSLRLAGTWPTRSDQGVRHPHNRLRARPGGATTNPHVGEPMSREPSVKALGPTDTSLFHRSRTVALWQ